MCFMHLLLTLLMLAGGAHAKGKLRPASYNVDLRETHLCANKDCSMTGLNVSHPFIGNSRFRTIVGNMIIDRPAKSWSDMKMIIHKCVGGISSNTCEYFFTWHQNKDLCRQFVAPLAPWYQVTGRIRPKWQCPVSPGLYVFENVTFDTAVMARIAGDSARGDVFWKIRFELLDEQKRCFQCFYFICRFFREGAKRPDATF